MLICFPQRGVRQALLLIGVLLSGAAASLGEDRLSVPDTGAQAEAMKLVRELYEQDYKNARTPAQQTALANKLFEQAAQSRDDPMAHFVILRVAKDIALQAADAKTALEAVDRMAGRYQIDASAMKVETLLSASANARLPEARKGVVEAAIPLIRAAIAEDDCQSANRLVRKALDLARRSRDAALMKQMVAISKEAAEAGKGYAALQQARAKLEEQPTDAEANLAVGRYLCLTKGDWKKGIPTLALGSDAELKALAVKELEGATSADEEVALADGWWDVAQTRKGTEKQALMLHAGSWYRQAQATLTSGLVKFKVRKRLDEIGKVGRVIPRVFVKPPLAFAPFNATKAKEHQQAWAEYLRLPVEREVDLPGGAKLTMVLIPPGEFLMGSTAEEQARFLEEAKAANEGPQHRVQITRPFYLGKYEVTQAQFEAVMGSNPSRFTDDASHPVERVSWGEVQSFPTKVNEFRKNQDLEFALPTEAQWEYACRAGTTTFWHCGESEAVLQEYAWFRANSGGKTHPVGQLGPNALGVHDMHGNVWEWCADWHAPDYYAQSPANDPGGPPSGSYRVRRGGRWDAPAGDCRSAHRGYGTPGHRGYSLGFRLASVVVDE